MLENERVTIIEDTESLVCGFMSISREQQMLPTSLCRLDRHALKSLQPVSSSHHIKMFLSKKTEQSKRECSCGNGPFLWLTWLLLPGKAIYLQCPGPGVHCTAEQLRAGE